MKKTKTIIYILSIFIILTTYVIKNAYADCFILVDKKKFIINEGDCKTRYTPASTFKIAISVMGYNEGILIDENNPKVKFKEGYVDWLDNWKQTYYPNLWIKNSCVWYSQFITKKLGFKKFKNYVNKLNYGNGNVSGDTGKSNGLTNAWLSSSLKISPIEQLKFLEKLISNKLPVSKQAQEMTKKILYIEKLGDWKLYGKTGNGLLQSDDNNKLKKQVGWFIGWIERNGISMIFTYLVVDDKKQKTYASLRAKDKLKKLLKRYNYY